MKKSMGFGERCKNSGLGLGLGLGVHDDDEESDHRNCMKSYYLGREKEEEDKVDDDDGLKCKYPCLTLGRPDHETKMSPECGEYNLQAIQQQQSNCGSGDSSFSNSSSMKRERESEVDGEIEITRLPNNSTCSRLAADVDDDGNPRKKLRLTKEQSAVLEDSFKHHSTLNPKQKQDLASKLKLRARQVEVWFQNRRARTKLKQTEVECELLKKCCETLTEENKRLQKELQELRSIKTTPQQGGSFYMQLPAAAAAAVCPSCGGGATTTASPAATAFLIGSQAAHHLYKTNYPFTHSSAAC